MVFLLRFFAAGLKPEPAARIMTAHDPQIALSNPSAVAPAKQGLLLVGHGTREAAGIEEFQATARLVATLAGGRPVQACFLEFARPTIAEGFRALAAAGVERVTVVPVLLFSAGHAERDIPAAVAAAALEFPHIEVGQCGHLGCHEALLALSQSRYDEALAGGLPSSADQPALATKIALVLVGRGSHDDPATAEMHQFTRLREALVPGVLVRTAFVAMAEPALDRVLEEVAATNPDRVVVQPHLLFAGVLLDRISSIVGEFARRYPRIEWLSVAHLGPAEKLAEALLDRAGALRN